MRQQWTDADTRAMEDVIRRCATGMDVAAAVSAAISRPVTYDMISARLRRAGKPAIADMIGRRLDVQRETRPVVEIPVDWEEPKVDALAPAATSALRAPSVKRFVFIPDVHAPYHDEKAFSLAIRAGKAFAADAVVSLGDLADCWAVSAHDKDPGRVMRFPEEMKITRMCVGRLGEIAKERYITRGNHEERLARYIATKAAELYGLLNIDDLMGLNEDGWNITPYRQILKLGKLNVTHDVKFAGSTAHTRTRDRVGGNTVIGHTHRMAVDYRGNITGSRHVGAMFGWLGSIAGIDYAHVADSAEWQHGFGVGYLMPNGDVHLNAVPIVDGRCVLEGRVIE